MSLGGVAADTSWSSHGDSKGASQTLAANSVESTDATALSSPSVMKHNDQQLQTLLRLARSCLKYDRLPGEMEESHFFSKFEKEFAEQSRQSEGSHSQRASLQESTSYPQNDQALGPLEVTPPLEGPDEEPPDLQTLKEQTAQIEEATALARKALEEATVEMARKCIKREAVLKEEKAKEVDLQRAQRQLRLAKDMIKRQNVEIKELYSNLCTLRAEAAGSTQSAPGAYPTPQPPPLSSRPKARPAPRLAGRPMGPRARAAMLVSAAEDAFRFSDSIGSSPSQPVPPASPPTAPLTTDASQETLEGTSVSKSTRRESSAGPLLPPSIQPARRIVKESILSSSNKNADTWKLYIP